MKTTNELIKIIKNNIDNKKYNIIKLNKNIDTSIDILSDRTRIVIENKITKERISLLSIIKVSEIAILLKQLMVLLLVQ